MTRARDSYNARLEDLADGRRLHAEATTRNREAILGVLAQILEPKGLVLEVGSGTGEHAIHFAPHLAPRVWQPSDPNPEMRASIGAWAKSIDCPTLRPPINLDVCQDPWPIAAADAVVAINILHIAPWTACEGLMRGAGRILPRGGVLYLYGAYRVGGQHTAPSNAAFDTSLRARNPAWGVRNLEDVAGVAESQGLVLAETLPMPNNNLSVIFHRT